jgi:lysozyme
MKTSEDGLSIIKKFEGLRLSAYQDSVGVWTIGYGSIHGVHPGMVITIDQADQMLRNEITTTESYVSTVVKQTISQRMFDALVSFTYNVGEGNLSKSSVLNLTNLGDFVSAADAFMFWNKAGGIVVNGLTLRRSLERQLFLHGIAELQAATASTATTQTPVQEASTPTTTIPDTTDALNDASAQAALSEQPVTISDVSTGNS